MGRLCGGPGFWTLQVRAKARGATRSTNGANAAQVFRSGAVPRLSLGDQHGERQERHRGKEHGLMGDAHVDVVSGVVDKGKRQKERAANGAGQNGAKAPGVAGHGVAGDALGHERHRRQVAGKHRDSRLQAASLPIHHRRPGPRLRAR